VITIVTCDSSTHVWALRAGYCTMNSECADTNACNGMETCVNNACKAGTEVCPADKCQSGACGASTLQCSASQLDKSWIDVIEMYIVKPTGLWGR
jgi:hypothetical protein